MDIDRRLSKDRKRARLSFEEQSFDVDVSGMQALIRLLAATRSAMLPEEPLEYVPPKSVHAVAEPSWTVEPELLNGISWSISASRALAGFISAYRNRRQNDWELIFWLLPSRPILLRANRTRAYMRQDQ